jgi:hypothetical protein
MGENMRPVKCLYCSEQIDRANEPFLTTASKRYAHQKCASEQENEKQLRENLNNFLYELFDGNVNYGIIGQQIKNFRSQYKYTTSGIAGTLYYCYKIKGMDISKAEGIGIVPFYYKEAKNYFLRLERGQENAVGNLEIVKKTIHIKPPKADPFNKMQEISLDKLEKELLENDI